MKKTAIFLYVIALQTVFADDYITQNISGGCNTSDLNTFNNKTYMFPIFQLNSYTCANGTFLPANTLGCAPCPNGFTCLGGTFDFNETAAQGITAPTTITQNATKVCSTSILKTINNHTYMVPVFEPNTININWDNGDNTSSSTTCEYDGAIVLPSEPTRPGYTFAGWRLKVN